MANENLENLVKIRQLKAEAPSATEIAGLIQSGLVRLADAKKSDLGYESRFDLAYNAAHALSLAALRMICLPITTTLQPKSSASESLTVISSGMCSRSTRWAYSSSAGG